MKIVELVARLLLGLMFVVFGLNGFLNFIPAPPPPPGLAGQFAGAMIASHYMMVVAFFQVVGGGLLLIGQFIPLGLTMLAPIIVNILLFHILLLPAGIAPGVVCTILWLIVFYRVRSAFSGLFVQKVAT